MTNKEPKRTVARKAAGTTGPAEPPEERQAPEPTPFRDALDYLDSWFGLVEPAASGARWEDDRVGLLHFLLARTERSLAAGVELPLEAFVRGNGLDGLDRVVLLALLRAAHQPDGDGGLLRARLLQSLGAETLGRQQAVLERVEVAGKLRDLGAVHCFPAPAASQRQYRLSPWLVEPLTTGGGSPEGLPEVPVDPYEEVEAVRAEAARLVEAIGMDATAPILLWQAPSEGRPGWDHLSLRRRRLEKRLEAAARSEPSRVGAEMRRLRLEGDERLAWAFLLHDALAEKPGVAVPLLVRFAGRFADPEAEARRLVGPGSKLAGRDCVRFNRADGSYLGRLAWLARDAAMRVVPWSRDAFVVRLRTDGEPLEGGPRRVGFDGGGVQKEDRAAAAAGREAR